MPDIVDYSKWRLNPDGNVLGIVGNFCMNDLLNFIQDYYIEHTDNGSMPEFIDITKEQQDYFVSRVIINGGIKFENGKLSEIQTPYGVIKVFPEEEKLKHFKNKWRIAILRRISSLLNSIADIFDTDEKEMVIAYSVNDNYRYPLDILCKDNKPGFLHIPGLFKYIEEINSLTECNNERMYEIASEIRELSKVFN